MRSSSIIRNPEFRPLAVVVPRRGLAAPEARPDRAARQDEQVELWAEQQREQARREAAEIIVQAEAEAELIRESAREAGQAEGYREGRQAGEASCQESVEVLARLAERARADVDGALRDAAAGVVELALAIARRVVEREVAVDPALIEPMVRAALREVADATVVRVRIHPDAQPWLAERWRGEAQIVADAALAPGDCVIDTVRGGVDARVETKLEEIAAVLRGVPPARPQEQE